MKPAPAAYFPFASPAATQVRAPIRRNNGNMGSLLVEVLERLNGARGFLYLIKNEQSMLVDADACFSLEYGKEPVRRQRSFESGDELGIVIEGDVRRFPEVRSPKLPS